MLEQLIGKGRDVRIFDPHIQLDTIYGSNRNFLIESIPHISRLLESDIERVLQWSDYLVLAQKQSEAVMDRVRQSGLPVLDLVGTVTQAPALALT